MRVFQLLCAVEIENHQHCNKISRIEVFVIGHFREAIADDERLLRFFFAKPFFGASFYGHVFNFFNGFYLFFQMIFQSRLIAKVNEDFLFFNTVVDLTLRID